MVKGVEGCKEGSEESTRLEKSGCPNLTLLVRKIEKSSLDSPAKNPNVDKLTSLGLDLAVSAALAAKRHHL
jgi:hypothetical protein